MDIDNFKEFIVEFVPLCIIVDREDKILWESPKLKEKFHVGKFLDLDISMIKKSGQSKVKIHGINYIGRFKNIYFGEKEYHLIYYKDISTLKNKDLKIEFLEEIIEKISDGIVASDSDGRIIIYNNAMEKLEDKRSKDMLGNFLWDAYEYTGEEKSEHRQVFYNGKPILNQYKAHAYKNGIPKYVQYSTYPFHKQDDKIGVYTISKNETKLHNLLSETIELKRQTLGDIRENQELLYKSNGTRFTFSDIIGSSDEMKKIINEAESIAWLDNNILIIGQTGTGKEMFAQSIHNHGKRRDEPFIGINCSAIPENLLESILFGTVAGAFTGAVENDGLFKEAGKGTLFLDELNSMPMNMQTKLLRVIQEKMVRPVGGKTIHPINCRIISAMNEKPTELIERGSLREDLFYRLGGFQIFIPPLIERRKDIFDLSDYFIRQFNQSMDRNIVGLSERLKKMMLGHSWPGNVREINHFIENLMVRANREDKYLNIEHIPNYIKKKMRYAKVPSIEDIESLTDTLNSIEKDIILETLQKNDWNVSKSARDLGIIRQSLIYRIKKLNIEK